MAIGKNEIYKSIILLATKYISQIVDLYQKECNREYGHKQEPNDKESYYKFCREDFMLCIDKYLVSKKSEISISMFNCVMESVYNIKFINKQN